jgi:hypothetical protein
MAAAVGTAVNLTTNDAWVLNSVFNPENSFVQPRVLVNSNLSHITHDPHADLTQAEIAAIRPLHCPEPSRALVETVVADLTNLITAHPTYASAYNNRAQAFALFADSAVSNKIWSDVSSAIRLASPPSPDDEVSQLQGTVLAAAYTQRAKLLWQAAQSVADPIAPFLGHSDTSQVEGIQWEDVSRLDSPELEGLANRDFEMAGRYGNEDARKMGIFTNPYGKLCGEIVRKAMREEMGKAFAFGI